MFLYAPGQIKFDNYSIFLGSMQISCHTKKTPPKRSLLKYFEQSPKNYCAISVKAAIIAL